MKFTPRDMPPEAADASRGHDRHPLKELAILTIGVGLICLALYLVAVIIADAIISRIPPSAEARLFSALHLSLAAPEDLEPNLAERKVMADRVLGKLLEHSNLKGLPVQLTIWDNSETNAVALPGFKIAVTIGLLNCLDDENGMAFVLAHELGHFSGRDHLRGLARNLGLRVILALVFSSDANLQLNMGQVGDLALLAHSRQREAAADRYALDLMQRTLGDTRGATRLFELLDEKRLPPWAYMFQSHPATAERISALRKQAQEPAGERPNTNGSQ